MARRRYRKGEGLLELSFHSDWKFSLALAIGSSLVGGVLIPGALGRSPLLAPLAVMLTPLAWLLALVFGGIAFVRFVQSGSPGDAGCDVKKESGRARDKRSAPVARSDPGLDRSGLHSFAWGASARPTSWSLDILDQIEWKRFEELCCAFYREKGIRAETTPLGADGGIDIRLFQDEANPMQATAIVQCKAWNQAVGVKAIRELRGVMAHEKIDKAFFMASNGFTGDARAFAAENRITLLDGKLFLAMLQRLPTDCSERLLRFATEGDWTTPTCPSCGSRMTGRQGSRGPFWGCVTYPKCRGLLPMRAKAGFPN